MVARRKKLGHKLGAVLNKIIIYISWVLTGFAWIMGQLIKSIGCDGFLLPMVFYFIHISLAIGSTGSRINSPGQSEFNNYDKNNSSAENGPNHDIIIINSLIINDCLSLTVNNRMLLLIQQRNGASSMTSIHE